MSGDSQWRVWIFGGGTALPSAERDNTFLAVEAGPSCWLIDCGGAAYQRLLQAGLSPLGLEGVILTHSHADHIYGLPALLFHLSLAGYVGPLPIYGLGETLHVARRVVEAFDLGEHCAPHRWLSAQVGENGMVDLVGAEVGIRVAPVLHSRPAVGVRIEGKDGGVVAYSGDTSPCPNLVSLAQGADWLLHECTTDRPFSGHSTPEDVAAVALQAGVKRLGIVHYDPVYIVDVKALARRIKEAGFLGSVRVLSNLDAIQWDHAPISYVH